MKDTAVPLRCGETPASSLWDLRPLVDLAADKQVVMVGEVHGTNEIGILSALLLDRLARKKSVNVVAFELPMDYSGPLDAYVQTGKNAGAEEFLEYFAPNMFASTLTRTARRLVEEGIPMRLVAVDAPQFPSTAITAIQQIATKLTTKKDYVLATLPTTISNPPTSAQKAQVDAYFEHIVLGQTSVCTELSAADCERLVAMTQALWVATFTPDAANAGPWGARREDVIYYNLKTAVRSAADRMFLHMGAFHTNKAELSAGSRLVHEHPVTKDKVFSFAPAFGDGSVINYAGRRQELSGLPLTLTSALTHTPAHPIFVSTMRPTAACEANPFGAELEDFAVASTSTRAENYDGYVHYGQLTPDDEPERTAFRSDIAVAETTAARPGALRELAAAFLEHRRAVEAKERAALRLRRR